MEDDLLGASDNADVESLIGSDAETVSDNGEGEDR